MALAFEKSEGWIVYAGDLNLLQVMHLVLLEMPDPVAVSVGEVKSISLIF